MTTVDAPNKKAEATAADATNKAGAEKGTVILPVAFMPVADREEPRAGTGSIAESLAFIGVRKN